jgi:hypothetical protein
MPRHSPYGLCMRCGFTYRLPQLRKEWTGLRVCGACWDARPADQRPPNYKPEGLPLPNASPDIEPVFGRASRDDL